jgi:hypothetical protein
MHKKNYESNPKFCKQKVLNAPNILGVSVILVIEIFLQDMSYKSRHKKVQHSFLKKKLNPKNKYEGKKRSKHLRFSLGLNSTPSAPSKLLLVMKEIIQK